MIWLYSSYKTRMSIAEILCVVAKLKLTLVLQSFSLTDGSIVLHSVTRCRSRMLTVLIVFILICTISMVRRRKSCRLSLYIITTILLLYTSLMFTMLKVPTHEPCGMFSSKFLLLCAFRSRVIIKRSRLCNHKYQKPRQFEQSKWVQSEI